MSAVHRAHDTVMGREVALKRLLPIEETNLNEDAGESLAREAAALARFQHPNVVTIFAFEEDEEGPFVVMELVEGDDLHNVVKERALSWDDFRDVAGQCLEPLVAAGDLNLLHRDIKPGNLMLSTTPSGRLLVKLLDFGLSKFSQQPSLQTLDQRGSFLGSIDFIAPEQLELKPLDQRTDLYSLGCVFYYMLAQTAPFTGANPAETSMNHIKHRCRPIGERRADLPPLVADWIMRLIARDPEDRPADARTALRQFQDALKGIPYEPEKDGCEDSTPSAGPTAGAAPVRTLKMASGPVPTRKTGPVAGAERPSSLPPAGTRTAGPARPVAARVPTKPASIPRPLPWKLILGGSGTVAALLATALLLRDPAPPAEFAWPTRLADDGRPEPPPLPVDDGLFAHFSASKGVFARDYLRPPEPGEAVAAWANLASPETERSLLRDEGDGQGKHLPFFDRYDGTGIPGLRAEFPGLSTTNRSALAMLKHPGVLPRGFTLVAAMRIAAGGDRLFLIQPPVADGRSVQLVAGGDGQVIAVYRGREEGRPPLHPVAGRVARRARLPVESRPEGAPPPLASGRGLRGNGRKRADRVRGRRLRPDRDRKRSLRRS